MDARCQHDKHPGHGRSVPDSLAANVHRLASARENILRKIEARLPANRPMDRGRGLPASNQGVNLGRLESISAAEDEEKHMSGSDSRAGASCPPG